jgi:hypothetical protein
LATAGEGTRNPLDVERALFHLDELTLLKKPAMDWSDYRNPALKHLST